jgi:myo-inositol 2-dehydrogenase / D-chiro-inositol 1-dehydrogenase
MTHDRSDRDAALPKVPAEPRAGLDRRTLIQAGAAAAATGLGGSAFARRQDDEDEDDATKTLRIGVVGCGGRGSGATFDALQADPNTKIVALGDVFPDRIDSAYNNMLLEAEQKGWRERLDVPPERRFSGFDCHEKVTDACDVVLFASTPHFRPAQVEYAVKAGKHMFVEKPVATDAPGLRRIWQACNDAKDKNIAVVTGLCYRYDPAKQATIARIREGLIGRIHAVECSYDTGALWYREVSEDASDMERQLRNWLYYTWASGDHVAEQAIHNLDKMIWAMDDVPPLKVKAQGGRIVRRDPKFGNVFDHFSAVYTFPNDVKGFFSCRQWEGAHRDVSDHVYGSKGIARTQSHYVENLDGEKVWRYRAEEGVEQNMYHAEHNAMFASIRAKKPIHDGDIMCNATLLALMCRMSAYTGQEISWNQALESKEDLAPKSYEFGPNPVQPVAQPGITPFV